METVLELPFWNYLTDPKSTCVGHFGAVSALKYQGNKFQFNHVTMWKNDVKTNFRTVKKRTVKRKLPKR